MLATAEQRPKLRALGFAQLDPITYVHLASPSREAQMNRSCDDVREKLHRAAGAILGLHRRLYPRPRPSPGRDRHAAPFPAQPAFRAPDGPHAGAPRPHPAPARRRPQHRGAPRPPRLARSASPPIHCAEELGVQEELARNCAPEEPLRLRIGITLGDIIIQDDGDIYGEGVNVATRLEQLAEPGGICLSGKVHDEVEGKIAVPWEEHGEYQVKNISRPVRVFAAPRSRGATPAGSTASAALERAAPVRIDHKRRVAAAIRDYLARERISREQFAFKTKLGKSTVEKLLIGLFSERTLAIVESHTDLKRGDMLEAPATSDAGPAPPAAAGAKALDRPSLAV